MNEEKKYISRIVIISNDDNASQNDVENEEITINEQEAVTGEQDGN